LIVRGRGPIVDSGPVATEGLAGPGLAIEGDGVVLAALRRRGEWLELRLVAETASATEAVVHGRFDEARDADLLGRPLGALETGPGALRLPLGPWEIRTVQLRSGADTAPP
jgi:alpha-mannosidase